MLADGTERAVGPGAVAPDRAVGRLGEGIAAGDAKAEAGLGLELTFLARRRSRVAEAQRVVGVVVPLGLAEEDLQHRPDGVELRRPVAAGVVQEAAAGEGREQDEARPRRHRPERGVGRGIDVEEGQGRHQSILGGQLQPPGEALSGHHVGPMGLHHQLRATRGARGRDHHGHVVGVHVGRAPPVGVGGVQVGRADHRHLEGPEQRGEIGVGHHQGGVDLLDEAGQLRRRALRVQGDLCGAHLHQRQPTQEVVGVVARGVQHPVAGLDAAGAEPGRGPLDPGLGFAVGQLQVGGDQPGPVGGCLDRGPEEPGDRPVLEGHRGSLPP